MSNRPLAVLGAGSWGTALAIYLARRKQQVRLWTHNAETLQTLKIQRINTQIQDFMMLV